MRQHRIHVMVTLCALALIFGQDTKSATAVNGPGQHPSPHEVRIKASDGTILVGSYYASATAGPGVLLFHQSNRTRKAWDDVARRLAAAGISTLTLDLRGFGGSGGKPYDKLTDQEIASSRDLWPSDIDKAWQFLISQRGIDGDVIGVGGAGYDGVDNSVQTARRHSAAIKSLALLSGETFLPGLQFLRQSSQLPGLFVVADDDEYPPTVDAMELLYATSSNPSKKFVHYAGERAPWKWYEIYEIGTVPSTGSHGTDMFKTHPELPDIIVRWFVSTLITAPGRAPADTLASTRVLDRIEMPDGVAQVTRELTEARRTDPNAQLFPEVALHIVGSDHLRVGDKKLAVEIFELNLLAYPESADAQSDLADAYLAEGKKDLARQHAEKALALLDSSVLPESSWSNSEPKRKELRRSVQRTLNRLSAAK